MMMGGDGKMDDSMGRATSPPMHDATSATRSAPFDPAAWRGPSSADLSRHREYLKRAKIYYAYQQIEDLFQPFTSSHPDANFQVALFLINTLGAPGDQLESIDGESDGGDGGRTLGIGSNNIPHGVSIRRILLTLAKNAKILGAYKLARWAYSRIDMMVVPENEVSRQVRETCTKKQNTTAHPFSYLFLYFFYFDLATD